MKTLDVKRTAVDDEVMQMYVEGGRKPLPEETFDVDSRTFQQATLDRITSTEGPFGYYGHRATWRNMHKDQAYKFGNMMHGIGHELGEWVRYRLGISPQGVDVPAGVDETGAIVTPKGPAIITGSGPSLDKLGPWIRHWKGAIFASMGNQVSTLKYYGADATHILNFDSQLEMEEVENLPISKDTKILTHPGIHPAVNEFFRDHQKYWYRVYTPNDPGVSKLTSIAYDFIHPTHFPFSCAISGQTALAHYMGYDPLIFVGCDYGFTEKQSRFTEWTCEKKRGRRVWTVNKPRTPQEDSKNVPLMLTKTGKLTHYIHQFYLKTTMGVYWLDGPNIIDCSDGLMNGITPKARLEDVIMTQGKCLSGLMKTKGEIRDRVEPWLARKGSFYVPMLGGYKLVETRNWKVEIPKLLGVLKKVDPEINEDEYMAHCHKMIDNFKRIDYGENNNA